MSNRRYTMLSKKHYMDMDKLSVVNKSERVNPNDTFIPWYFWSESYETKTAVGFEMKDDSLVNIYSEIHETCVIDLQGITLNLVNELRAGFCFYDTRKKKRHEIVIVGDPHLTTSVNRGSNKKLPMVLDDVIYSIKFDGVEKAFVVDTSDKSAFNSVGYLATKTIEETAKSRTIWLNYGLLMRPFEVEYLGRELEGSCYIYIYGLWAILLQDNLSFDALVLLKGVDKDKIVVDKFIYTSNIYIIKILTLWKKEIP